MLLIPFHQVHLRRPAPCDLLLRHPIRPQPCCINMAVSDAPDRADAVRRILGLRACLVHICALLRPLGSEDARCESAGGGDGGLVVGLKSVEDGISGG
jgi:hypothetical protein